MDDFSEREQLGATHQVPPESAVAIKYPPEEKETVLREIPEWAAGLGAPAR